MKAPYPKDNPLSRLDKLQQALYDAKTPKEKEKAQQKIDLLRNGG